MPGIATHYIFGLELYQELSRTIGESERERDAFLLGNQGPDPFFYLVVSPFPKQLRSLGSMLHSRKTPELLCALHDCCVVCETERAPFASSIPADEAAAVRAYALGFLCHFILDSTVHPLVYAQQYALCRAGIDGVKRQRTGRAVHAMIETELDEYVMTSHLAMTAGHLLPHEAALRCASADLRAVSHCLADAVGLAYGLSVPSSLFEAAVQLNRMGQGVLDSKSADLRRRIGAANPGGLFNVYVLTIAHENRLRLRTAFANDDHIPWPHPTKEGEVFSASFDELYECAFSKALSDLPAFADSSFDKAQCEALVGGVNFSGRSLS